MRIKTLLSVLEGHRVFIQTHNFPDPDAIASAFGLQTLLQSFGTDSTICYQGKIEKLNTLRMLDIFHIEMKNINDIPDMTEEDYIITIDAQKYNKNLTDFIGDEIACIDHHPTFIECKYQYSDIRPVGACSSIIAEYYLESGVPLSTEVASALVYGIKMDTLDFRRGVTQFDIDIYGKLFSLTNKPILTSLLTNTMEFNDLKAYGAAIENIHVYDSLGVAYIPFDCPDALIAMVSDFILSLDVVDFSVIYSARKDGYKFSARSEISNLNAGTIINHALADIGNGGGHAAFAGGFVPYTNLPQVESQRHHQIHSLFIQELAATA